MGKLYIKIKNDGSGQINWVFVGDTRGLENTGRKFKKSPVVYFV